MFGLSTREVLSKAIVNACINNKGVYRNALQRNIDKFETETDEALEKLIMDIRREYLDAVADSVFNSYRISSPTIFTRIQLALMSPGICGYSDINLENGIMAGSVFAICFYAVKNSVAPPKECIRLNHIQNDIMNSVLAEIDG